MGFFTCVVPAGPLVHPSSAAHLLSLVGGASHPFDVPSIQDSPGLFAYSRWEVDHFLPPGTSAAYHLFRPDPSRSALCQTSNWSPMSCENSLEPW